MRLSMYRLIGAAVLAGLALLVMSLPDTVRSAIGIALAGFALIMLLVSWKQLGKSFAITLQARELVTAGLYSKIQHPLFFFVDLLLLGLIIWFDAHWFLLAWGILIAIHILEARREEKFLHAAFGEKYTLYQAATWF